MTVEPKDAVHVATALAAEVHQLDTLRIGRPSVEGKLPLE